MLFETNNIPIQELDSRLLREKNIKVKVARLDKIHPVISGNKLFKLHYFLEAARRHKQPIVTFGGPYSNHLAATAYACRLTGLTCFGVVRGEQPSALSATLTRCVEDGMKLMFTPRKEYSEISQHPGARNMPGVPAGSLFIPEGGYSPTGAKGASLIMDMPAALDASFIVTALGTATTTAGLLQKVTAAQQVIAVPVLKNLTDIPGRLLYLNGKPANDNIIVWDHYHFGGYAKKTQQLIRFMNELYEQHGVPTDFVYTAKMMFAVMDKINAGFFPRGCTILCLHTGGLQGNQSLEKDQLIF